MIQLISALATPLLVVLALAIAVVSLYFAYHQLLRLPIFRGTKAASYDRAYERAYEQLLQNPIKRRP